MLMKNHTKKNQEKSITEFKYTIRLMGNWKVILLTPNTITFNVYWDICGLCDHAADEDFLLTPHIYILSHGGHFLFK